MDLNHSIISRSVDHAADDEGEEEDAEDDGWVCSLGSTEYLPGFVQRHVILAGGGSHLRRQLSGGSRFQADQHFLERGF